MLITGRSRNTRNKEQMRSRRRNKIVLATLYRYARYFVSMRKNHTGLTWAKCGSTLHAIDVEAHSESSFGPTFEDNFSYKLI